MAVGGVLGQVRVAYAIGSPHTWKKLEQVYDCEIPTAESDDIDNTTFGDTDYKSSFPGMATVSQAKIMMMKDASIVTAPNQNSLFDLRATKTLVYWRFELADNNDLTIAAIWEAYEFRGRVKSFKPTAQINSRATVEVSVLFDKIDGFVRYYPMASLIG